MTTATRQSKRWLGRLPPEVMRALELLHELGHAAEAQAAFDALKPKPAGRPRLGSADVEDAAAAFRAHWRRRPGHSFTQASKAIARARGGALSPRSIRHRLTLYCRERGTTVAAWESDVKEEAEHA